MTRGRAIVLLLAWACASPSSVAAQAIGTFRWQMQPFCNVLTLSVRQTATTFRLEGADDQCQDGSPTADVGVAAIVENDVADGPHAPVAGAALVNPDSTVSLGLVIVSAPDGVPLHVNARLDLRTVSGEWRDSVGRTGAFVLTPGSTAGGDRRPDVPVGLRGLQPGSGLAMTPLPESARLDVDVRDLRRTFNLWEVPAGLSIGAGALDRAAASAQSNIAIGPLALLELGTGQQNVAIGPNALRRGGDGFGNTALGPSALVAAKGAFNVGIGAETLRREPSGSRNMAIGVFALDSASGDGNIAIGGTRAGDEIVAGHNNVAIGSEGFGPDDGTIRIGDGAHTATFMAGVFGRAAAGGVPLLVNPGGRLGTVTSSARFKDDIASVDDADRIFALRPVQFRYRPEHDDGSRLEHYGLIAEDVAATMPELAVFDEAGRPSAVRYHLLIPLLLHQLQRLRAELAVLQEVVP